jgi:hypothetical protein
MRIITVRQVHACVGCVRRMAVASESLQLVGLFSDPPWVAYTPQCSCDMLACLAS